MEKLQFRISSGLKDLIGKDLITDDFVAIFELVKNSYDAHASNVRIAFQGLNLQNANSQITIFDDGKGMDEIDLREKWLFVAYSAKREGLEESDNDRQNYREKIKAANYYAGAKGIGRFSCDRLGRQLTLTTRKGDDEPYHILNINWSDFEEDSLKEFVSIDVTYSAAIDIESPFDHGTRLEITSLRSVWDRAKLLALKDRLSRLITPSLLVDKSENKFSINIEAEEFRKEDDEILERETSQLESLYRHIVNGEIKNFVFEALELKTTHIICQVSDPDQDGVSFITSTLIDRTNKIYEIRERNSYKGLHGVTFNIFYLNTQAKISFSKRMGIKPVTYGNIFIYKNGFRIAPYGDQDYDTFGLNRRKVQGTARYLGLRELIGRVEIRGDNPELREKTSRDGGLIDTETYHSFVDCFFEKVIKRLEKYIVDVRQWGVDLEKESLLKIRHSVKNKRTGEVEDKTQVVKENLIKLVANLSEDQEIIYVKPHQDIIKLIDVHQGDSTAKIIAAFKKLATKENNSTNLKSLRVLEKRFKKLRVAKESAEKAADTSAKEAKKAAAELKLWEAQNFFLKDSLSADTVHMQSLLHHTEKATYFISKMLEKLMHQIDQGAKASLLYETIGAIGLQNQKIYAFTKYHKSTKFNTDVKEISKDIIGFISEYLANVCKYYDEYEGMEIHVEPPPVNGFILKFSPIDITIVIDNILSNAKRSGSRKVIVSWALSGTDELSLKIFNRGKRIDRSIIDKIFDFRFTTTKGAGMGLFHARSILEGMGCSIKANPNLKDGAEFIVTFKRRK